MSQQSFQRGDFFRFHADSGLGHCKNPSPASWYS
jgi:hypothetical protein